MTGRIDRTELISKLKSLAGLTDEERSSLIGLLRQHKKYGLVWEDKPEEAERLLEDQLPVLKEVKERAILNGADAPNHILIEGDNLHALTALSYTHAGKIDVIYIDPPYNTGNKDFVYNDSFVDTEDAYRHSKWLSFMSKRLKIAKKLLSDKGVIFISIDDNEQAQLKLLCDEIFGIPSFVATLMIESSVIAGPRRVPAMQGSIVKTAEYCLIYTRNEDTKIMRKLKYDYIDGFDTHYSKWADEKNDEIINFTDLLRKTKEVADAFDSYKLPISIQNIGIIISIDKKVKDWLYSEKIASKLFRQGDKESLDNIDNIPLNHLFRSGNKWYVKTENTIYNVFRYIDRIGECDDYFCKFGERTVRGNLWKGFSSDGGNLDKEGGVSFKSGKKPIRLIKQLIDSVCLSKESIILDFFAGSGTTMHATMRLNADDGGKRKCILVTNNESGICERITYERNRKVIQGYSNIVGLKHNNLRYYKTEFISRERTVKNMRALVSAATDLLCIKENVYQEQEGFGGLPYNNKVYRYFEENSHRMLIIYQEEFIPAIVSAIEASTGKEGVLKVYVFSPDRDPYADEFWKVEDRVALCALPAAIYDAYMQVLPRRKDKAIAVNEEQVVTEAEEWEA